MYHTAVCFVLLPTGIWNNRAASLSDPTLRTLASQTLPSLLMSAKAPTSTTKYKASWKKWENWAASKPEVTAFPVSPFHFSLYSSHNGFKSTADLASAAVKWVHSLAGLRFFFCKRGLASPQYFSQSYGAYFKYIVHVHVYVHTRTVNVCAMLMISYVILKYAPYDWLKCNPRLQKKNRGRATIANRQ